MLSGPIPCRVVTSSSFLSLVRGTLTLEREAPIPFGTAGQVRLYTVDRLIERPH